MNKKRYVDIEEAMPILDAIKNDHPDPMKSTLIKLCKDVLKQLPAQEIEELTPCGHCAFRSATWHCTHKDGLMGKLRPTYYCMYGSPTRPEDYVDDISDEFEEFDDGDEIDD